MNVSELKAGESAIIKSVEHVDAFLQQRLLSIGVLPGCELCLKRASFMKGPCILECRGQSISIRQKDAQMIEVHA
ncbi:FeoA family protein [Paenisporosarcina cavernae]|uniref:Ferrous iron transport protein A n=1 Tax=Paenisporosarcina cavernae TaxID=2320858 RepID=A0A385YRH0_9BACL|nr:FeoA family protein [Paenisporosarcina cavernae]AYC28597.1 ferrous iron transport protein A [Paenisporosarcina cavernae]